MNILYLLYNIIKLKSIILATKPLFTSQMMTVKQEKYYWYHY
jgi:hypothetical protein